MSIEYNNTKDKWIKDSGITSENELINEIKKYAGDNRYFLAYCTDRFYAGRAELEQFNQLNKDNVLEIRLFSEREEILFIRSTVGTDFQWRIASEDKLDKSEYMVQYQTLDLNQNRINENNNQTDTFGNKVLYTTVGGEYSLPISGNEDSSKIISYINYDENGMAKITDYRVCGFVKKPKKEKVI